MEPGILSGGNLQYELTEKARAREARALAVCQRAGRAVPALTKPAHSHRLSVESGDPGNALTPYSGSTPRSLPVALLLSSERLQSGVTVACPDLVGSGGSDHSKKLPRLAGWKRYLETVESVISI
jgi:hypothetical protein